MATSTKSPCPLPEDDGMGDLRKRLLDLQARELSGSEKARAMHEMLLEGYRRSRSTSDPEPSSQFELSASPPSTGKAWKQAIPVGALESLKFWQHSVGETPSNDEFVLTPEDVKPTYAPVRIPKDATPQQADELTLQPRPLGCSHYRRNVKLQCSTCGKWYTCRFCHDAVENHSLIRKDTKNMLCMLCAKPQKANDACINCGESASRYYCGVCKLWDDHPDKNIYHCNDCGICRRGRGLGKDFFHCKKCCACISISIQDSHKCIERSTDCDCPICGEYMFTSPKPVVFMVCGHSIHSRCYNEHMLRSYKCPICNKSLLNMQTYFRRLDLDIQGQPMPPEFRDTTATILCNDCSGKSTVPYHWLGLKCAICASFNTAEIRIHGHSGMDPVPAPGTSAAQAPTGSLGASIGESTAADVVGSATSANVIAGQPPRSRRHSSHASPDIGGQGARVLVPDRLARSASPPPGMLVTLPSNLPHTADDDDADDLGSNMLGLWRSRFNESSSDEAESASDEDDDDDDDDVEEEEDEEDDMNGIVLIGHR